MIAQTDTRSSSMTLSQTQKADSFRTLHQGPGAFVIPNPWDAGSARILAGLRFQALATSSGAFAGTLGRRDGKVRREEALAHARAVVAAVDLPVSADLENGFGHAASFAAETVRLAAETGLVGCSIEDATGEKDRPLYDSAEATERVAASAAAARSLGFAFTLTARSENFLRGNPNLDDTIKRLQAYEKAGADVLMAAACPTSRRSGMCVRHRRSRSISWPGSKANHSRKRTSKGPACAASAWLPRSTGRLWER
jgi:2-methylisocitrate lyase-like PEP mutase family enzyme